MSKQITFEFNHKDYTLEFTRDTIRQMERRGFNLNEFSDKPATMLPALFSGAFLAHHRNEKQEVINKIFDSITEKDTLIGKLTEMYTEPIEAMLSEPAESEGNVNWTASW